MKIDFSIVDVRVLIVDDQVQMRKSIARILETMGCKSIVECSSGIKALQEIKKRSFDLIITDILMEKMDGCELIEQIRGQNVCADVPIIAVSGESDRDQIIKINRIGATSYLIKPFTFDDLANRVVLVLSDYFYPPEPFATIHQIEKLLIAGDYHDGLEKLLNLESSFEEENRIKYLKILLLTKLNKLNDALKITENCLEHNPGYYRFYSAMADLHLIEGRDIDAIKSMEKELLINPKNLNRQVQLGHLLIKIGNPLQALYHFKQAIQEKPRHKQALQGAGKSLALSGDLDKSIAYFLRYRRHHPDDPKPFDFIVKYCLEANQFQKAEQTLKQEIKGTDSNSHASIALGQLYLRQNKFTEARKILEPLLLRDHNDFRALSLFGELEYRQKNFMRAEELLIKACRIESSMETLHFLAKTYMAQNKYTHACEALERALFICQNPRSVFYLLGHCYFSLAENCKALMCFNLAFKHGENSADCQNAIESCRTTIQQERTARLAS